MNAHRFFVSDPVVWRCFSQVRDQAANENMTVFMQNRVASDFCAWAASKASNPAFSSMCVEAVRAAQVMKRESRRRAGR